LNAAYPDGWCVLMYVPCNDDMLVVAMSPTGFTTDVIEVDAAFQAALARATRPAYREYTYLDLAYHNGGRNEAWADLNMLGTRLIPRSIWPALEADRRLLVIPCGMLHALPWPALRIEGQWLIERAIIQQAASLRCWIDLQNRPAPGRRALLLGIHQFQQRAPELPDSTATTDILRRYWQGPIESYHNAAVNREMLLNQAVEGQLREYGLLHLSTHGHLVESRGLLAHLKLYDSDLFYDDVTQLDLGPGLVVLATCDGAGCEVLPGEEVLSIGNGFLKAGARDVVASLWQLYAAVVPAFLEPFYAALSRGVDAPTALAAAQRTLLAFSSGNPPEDAVFRAPLAWASMCVCGAGTTTTDSLLSAVVAEA
jgi:CHAT domain-containing protein